MDPYASEKPLFTITAENLSQYAERLTDGQKAMFAKYPKTYRMPVYPGHRDFRFSDAVCAAAKKNAENAVLEADGLGTVGAVKGALPFPIPKSGLELAFNNLLPSRAFTEHTLRDNANVLADGSIVWGRADNKAFSQVNDPANERRHHRNFRQMPVFNNLPDGQDADGEHFFAQIEREVLLLFGNCAGAGRKAGAGR